MIKRLLIANRGEIAVRVIRACREMGIGTVAVYSEADRDNLHVRLADKAVCIGPPPSSQSYLIKENLIAAALKTGCQAIHPGVGFLSEQADFARAVVKAGLIFIGPDADLIELLGDKVRARETAKNFGLPITPGTEGAVSSAEEAAPIAEKLGYPVLIKAASGGGGKGMRIVNKKEELAENLSIASREAEVNFGDGTVFIEKFIEDPRHVELQILADGRGGVTVLGERDCSVQKRHQKLIEESPSLAVDKKMRKRMAKGAIRMFSKLKYCGAGTIEFLVSGKDFYFMEVNARVQVEHPVSELVSGVDIIRQQILATTEGRMEIPSGNLPLSGWAMECRINAQNPGEIIRLEVPGGPGVRWDSFLYQGYIVSPYYDSMVGKLIVHAPTRIAAIERMERALDELVIEGIKTNREEQRCILAHAHFRYEGVGTGFYAEIEEELNCAQ